MNTYKKIIKLKTHLSLLYHHITFYLFSPACKHLYMSLPLIHISKHTETHLIHILYTPSRRLLHYVNLFVIICLFLPTVGLVVFLTVV